jgi:hypothetical protein
MIRLQGPVDMLCYDDSNHVWERRVTTRAARLRVATVGAVCLLITAGRGHAAPPPAAVSLFDECVTTFERGQFQAADACFLRVLALYPSGVVLHNLGRINERLGRLLEAYDYYQRSTNAAVGTLTPAELQEVERRRDRLRLRLGLLVVGPRTAGVTITIDGRIRSLGRGKAVPLLPGPHEVTLTAAGHEPLRVRVTLAAGEIKRLEPPLEPIGRARPVPAAPEPTLAPVGTRPEPEDAPAVDPAPRRWQRLVGYGTAGAGVAALVVGTVMGAVAMSRADDAKAHCSPTEKNLCDPQGLGLRRDAQSAATVSTATLATGGVLVVAGVLLWALAPREARRTREGSVRLQPQVGPRAAALALEARW